MRILLYAIILSMGMLPASAAPTTAPWQLPGFSSPALFEGDDACPKGIMSLPCQGLQQALRQGNDTPDPALQHLDRLGGETPGKRCSNPLTCMLPHLLPPARQQP